MEAAPRPWFDLAKYKEVRLREALYEAEIAERSLEELTRNAAGKAFQARRALAAAHAADKAKDLCKAYPGVEKLRGLRKRVEKAYWILAVMPTTALKKVACRR